MLSGTEVEVGISVNGWGDYKEMVASMAISANARVNLSKIPELCKLNYL